MCKLDDFCGKLPDDEIYRCQKITDDNGVEQDHPDCQTQAMCMKPCMEKRKKEYPDPCFD